MCAQRRVLCGSEVLSKLPESPLVFLWRHLAPAAPFSFLSFLTNTVKKKPQCGPRGESTATPNQKGSPGPEGGHGPAAGGQTPDRGGGHAFPGCPHLLLTLPHVGFRNPSVAPRASPTKRQSPLRTHRSQSLALGKSWPLTQSTSRATLRRARGVYRPAEWPENASGRAAAGEALQRCRHRSHNRQVFL